MTSFAFFSCLDQNSLTAGAIYASSTLIVNVAEVAKELPTVRTLLIWLQNVATAYACFFLLPKSGKLGKTSSLILHVRTPT